MDKYARAVVEHEAAYNAKGQWHDKNLAYWFQALVEEIGELGAALNGEHEHPPETELKQIGAIAIGMARQIDRLNGIDVGPVAGTFAVRYNHGLSIFSDWYIAARGLSKDDADALQETLLKKEVDGWFSHVEVIADDIPPQLVPR